MKLKLLHIQEQMLIAKMGLFLKFSHQILKTLDYQDVIIYHKLFNQILSMASMIMELRVEIALIHQPLVENLRNKNHHQTPNQ